MTTEYIPHYINDERSKELYLKYINIDSHPDWTYIDILYVREINLQTMLDVTGLTIDEVIELNSYGDESWELHIDIDNNIITEYNF
jgi:hypothetical protein